MKRSFSDAVVGVAVFALGLTGCNSERFPAYSSSVKYGVRTDPIVKISKELGEDRYEPDRPGLLPIMKVEDMLRLDHPYNPKMISGNEENLRKVAYRLAEKELPINKDANESERQTIEEQRKKRQEELLPSVRSNPRAYQREFEEALDKNLRFPALLSDADKQAVEQGLETMFGTPAKPMVNAKEAGIDAKIIEELKLDDKILAEGSTYYRVHCLHCHGVPGNGRGPTAHWVNPHPRDFRGGTFKFQSVDRASGRGDAQPTRADLLRTLRQGVEATAMPSFGLLPDDQQEALVSYVIHLSIRGRVESNIILNDFELDPDNGGLKRTQDDNGKPTDIPAEIKFFTERFVTQGWAESSKPASAIVVKPYPYDENDPDYMTKILPASVKRGQEIFKGEPSDESKDYFAKQLYLAKKIDDAKKKDKAVDLAKLKAEVEKDYPTIDKDLKKGYLEEAQKTLGGPKCVTCHVNFGRQSQYKYDDWGTLARPRDLTLGVFRGGRRPVDIYYRIHSGIPGTVMVSYGKSPFEGREQYMWDIVNFVTVLPYPDMRKSFGIKLD